MRYTSTRDNHIHVTSSQAIAGGISREGGLYLPVQIPRMNLFELRELAERNYAGRAEYILSKYLTVEGGWAQGEVLSCVRRAYSSFRDSAVAPIRPLSGRDTVLELFHGPTCAFKDLALQLLPHLLTASAQKTMNGQDIVILVATSGDTGKAALEGFRDVPGTKIAVFYPEEGVSAVQKQQMRTQEGSNVRVVGVRGNFDDTQNGVKAIFADQKLRSTLAARGQVFSSANSINWGRLVPQIVYYISAYCDLMNQQRIALGEAVNFVVPTGNFGNILAGYYAKAMGLPIKKLICASNRNRILTDFFETGTYDRNRPFFTTTSPSMDILISSNLERMLFLATRNDSNKINRWMQGLKQEGLYHIPQAFLQVLQGDFDAGSCDEAQTAQAILRTWQETGYLCDTHTACALHVMEEYRSRTKDATPCVVVATASPYKFASDVLSALSGQPAPEDEFAALAALEQRTGVPCPPPLLGLDQKPIRFSEVCDAGAMAEFCTFS